MASPDEQGYGGDYYRDAAHRARDGFTRRPAARNYSGDVQLQIDDLEQGTGGYGGAGSYGVADLRVQGPHDVEAGPRYHHPKLVDVLKQPFAKAQTALQNKTRRLNPRNGRNGSNLVKNAILFAFVCIIVLLMLYLRSKFSGIWK